MRLIDLTRTLDPTAVDRMPEAVRPLAAVLAPKIQYLAPDAEGRDRMCAIFGCTPDDLPGREGWGEELLTLNSHSGTHVALASIGKERGIDWLHVPFKGDGPVVNAILGGHVEVAGLFSVYKPHVTAGKLRPLLSLMDTRVKFFPEVPTYKDLGFKFETKGSVQSITGIIGPAGIPAPIVAKYEAALRKAVESPEFQKTVEIQGMAADFQPAADYRREMEEGYHNAGRMLKEIGLVK